MGETGLLEWFMKFWRKEVDWKLPPEVPGLPYSPPPTCSLTSLSPALEAKNPEELAVRQAKAEGGWEQGTSCILKRHVSKHFLNM